VNYSQEFSELFPRTDIRQLVTPLVRDVEAARIMTASPSVLCRFLLLPMRGCR